MTLPQPSLKALLDFLKTASLHPSCRPGFGRVLQVSHSFLSPANVSILVDNNNNEDDDGDGDTTSKKRRRRNGRTIVRYRGQKNHESPPSVGLLLALLDEMTTNAIFLHGNPAAPGASIHMRLELAGGGGSRHGIFLANKNKKETAQEFIMDSSVVKSGKTMSFTECKIYRGAGNTKIDDDDDNNSDDPDDHDLIAYGSQVKYLPSGNFLMDTLFTNPFLWNMFVNSYVRRTDPPVYSPEAIGTVHDHLTPTAQSVGRATFRMTPYLTNPLGVLHGGAQGMMMEMVGQSLAQGLLKTDHVQLVAIQVDFQSSGKKGEVEVIAQEIHHDVATAQVAVRMVDRTTGRFISTGNLRFVATAPVDDDDNLLVQRSGPIMSRI